MQPRILVFLLFSMILAMTACSSGEVSQDPVTIDNQEDTTATNSGEDTEQGPAPVEPQPDPAPQDPLPDPAPPEPEPLPPQPEPQCQPTDDELLMLNLVNNVRAESRQCGAESYAATQALTWNCELRDAAEVHSQDMVTNNFFDHTGSDGLNVGHRVTATGYSWRSVGENIAAGYLTEEQVMQGWLDSPGHCANIMSPSYRDFGSAVIFTDQADYSSYWTQVFAAPR